MSNLKVELLTDDEDEDVIDYARKRTNPALVPKTKIKKNERENKKRLKRRKKLESKKNKKNTKKSKI